MSLSIREISETLNLRREDMQGNRMLTNELIIDDIMVGLGYNKKRDTNVKRLYSGPIDWKVTTPNGKKLAVKVFALDEAINKEEVDVTLKECADARYSIVLVTNGEEMTVCRYDKRVREYVEVADISLTEELSDLNKSIVEAISRDTFDLEVIDALLKTATVTLEEIAEIYEKHKIDFVNMVATWIRASVADCSNADEQAKLFVESLGNKDNADVAVVDDTLKDEYEAQISEFKTKMAEYEAQIKELQTQIENSKTEETEVVDNTAEVEELKSQIQALTAELETAKASKSEPSIAYGNGDTPSQEILDDYIEQIRDLTVKLAETEEEVRTAKDELETAKNELNNLAGSDKKQAEELLGVIADNPELDRHYVAVINTELMQFDELHTFIGRCLQKLYDIKSYEASQYIFNGDIFKLDGASKNNDLMMNNKTYDIILGSTNEDEELNKLRIVFSHFSDVIFMCKKIGTLKSAIVDRSLTESKPEEIKVESDEYLSDEDENDSTDSMETETNEFSLDDTDTEEGGFEDSEEGFDELDEADSDEEIDFSNETSDFVETSEIHNDEAELLDDSESDGFDELEETDETEGGFEDSDGGFDELDEAEITQDAEFEAQPFGNLEGQEFVDTDNTEEMVEADFNQEGFVDGFDDGDDTDGWDAEESGVEEQLPMEEHLLVGQLLNIDMLIWTEEPVVFNNIKYISTNSITFAINTPSDSLDMLLCKCIDAVLAIAAYDGDAAVVNKLKHKDFSLVNNFLKLYTEEYKGYPRINGTRYAIVGITSIQQVASVLLDICNEMGIPTEEIFVYFDAETSSEFIVDNYDFSEEAIQLKDTSVYELPEETNSAIAILKGDMLNNIVVTKNSLKAHKDILTQSLAIKTKYLAKAIDSEDAIEDIVGTMLMEAHRHNLAINFSAFGNLIGTNYKLLSRNANEVGENPFVIIALGDPIYCARMENWQVTHALLKIHTTLFNDTAIAIKNSVNSDAINFYSKEFETAEPSLALAITSFVQYVIGCIKVQ